jgi:hypothetical protein
MNVEKDACQQVPLRRSAAGGGPGERTRDGSWRNRKHKSHWDLGRTCVFTGVFDRWWKT